MGKTKQSTFFVIAAFRSLTNAVPARERTYNPQHSKFKAKIYEQQKSEKSPIHSPTRAHMSMKLVTYAEVLENILVFSRDI